MPVVCVSCGSSDLDLVAQLPGGGRLLSCADCGTEWTRGGPEEASHTAAPARASAPDEAAFAPAAHPGSSGGARFVWLAESNKALAYHSSNACPALLAAQQRVAGDGGTNSRVIQRRLRDAESDLDRTPCETCWTYQEG